MANESSEFPQRFIKTVTVTAAARCIIKIEDDLTADVCSKLWPALTQKSDQFTENHMWRKFIKSKQDGLQFFNSLDATSQGKIIVWSESYKGLEIAASDATSQKIIEACDVLVYAENMLSSFRRRQPNSTLPRDAFLGTIANREKIVARLWEYELSPAEREMMMNYCC